MIIETIAVGSLSTRLGRATRKVRETILGDEPNTIQAGLLRSFRMTLNRRPERRDIAGQAFWVHRGPTGYSLRFRGERTPIDGARIRSLLVGAGLFLMSGESIRLDAALAHNLIQEEIASMESMRKNALRAGTDALGDRLPSAEELAFWFRRSDFLGRKMRALKVLRMAANERMKRRSCLESFRAA